MKVDIVSRIYLYATSIQGTSVLTARGQVNTSGNILTGILDLASLYVRRPQGEEATKAERAEQEAVLRKVQEGGDFSEDLRQRFWHTPEALAQQLTSAIVKVQIERLPARLSLLQQYLQQEEIHLYAREYIPSL